MTYTLYKADVSYFSGKLEAYLHYKEIPHEAEELTFKTLGELGQKTGIQKMPAIEMTDGRWLFDTTPTIQWLETQHPQGSIDPEDPALRFLALLLEDYADEWLWRPAMWWRWVPPISRLTLGRRIGRIYAKALAIPMGWYFARRQLKQWLWDDGVDESNSESVRDMFYRELEFLEPLLEQQPFLLGSHPSAADFGYFGPFFRHFGNDPDSAEVMRREGPNTYEWLARLWNSKHSKLAGVAQWQWPEADYWQPLLERIARDYLPYLHQNAVAFRDGQARFDYRGNSLEFKQTVTTHYRVWCRQEIQREFAALSEADQQRVEDLFASVGGLASLNVDGVIESGMGQRFQLPMDPLEVKNRPGLITRLMGQPRN